MVGILDIIKNAVAIGGLVGVLNCATTNQPSSNLNRVCSVGVTSIDYFGNGIDYLCACGEAGYETLGRDDSSNAARKMLAEKLGKRSVDNAMVLETSEDKDYVYSIVCVGD